MSVKPYNFTIEVDSEDLILRNGVATRYGGADDGEDNGEGAGGFHTTTHPAFLGIALPMRSRAGNLWDSPIPRLPITHSDGVGGALVRIYSRKTGKTAHAQVEDIGPSRNTGRVADLTNALVLALGHTLAEGIYPVDVRILGGKRYLPKG